MRGATKILLVASSLFGSSGATATSDESEVVIETERALVAKPILTVGSDAKLKSRVSAAETVGIKKAQIKKIIEGRNNIAFTSIL